MVVFSGDIQLFIELFENLQYSSHSISVFLEIFLGIWINSPNVFSTTKSIITFFGAKKSIYLKFISSHGRIFASYSVLACCKDLILCQQDLSLTEQEPCLIDLRMDIVSLFVPPFVLFSSLFVVADSRFQNELHFRVLSMLLFIQTSRWWW